MNVTDRVAVSADAATDAPAAPRAVRKLSFWTMAAYGFGQIGEALHNAGFGVFLIFYYQQIIGVSGTLTGLAMFVSLAFDAVADPVIGAVSDRTRTRWGRRHPFIVLAAVPLACFFFALFNPPAGLSPFQAFLWLTTFLILARATMSCYLLPLTALGAEMARDYAQRSTMYAFNVLFGAVGGTIAIIVAYPGSACKEELEYVSACIPVIADRKQIRYIVNSRGTFIQQILVAVKLVRVLECDRCFVRQFISAT